MSNSVEEMRMRLHELVKGGEILEAVKEVGRYYRFKNFEIEPNRDDFAVYSCAYASDLDDNLSIGTDAINELYEISQVDADSSAKEIDFVVPHERGHADKHAEPVMVRGKNVPYSATEIRARQSKIGMDEESDEAKLQRESQANTYAVIKYHDGRNLDELVEGIATATWHQSIYTCYDKLKDIEKKAGAGFRNMTVECQAWAYLEKGAGFSWLKPEALAKIAEKVVEIDKNYRSKLAGAER